MLSEAKRSRSIYYLDAHAYHQVVTIKCPYRYVVNTALDNASIKASYRSDPYERER